MRLIDADALKKRMVNEPVKAVQDVDFQAEWFTRIADTVCHMIDMVDEAPTVAAPRWHRVEEELPDKTTTVLVWVGVNYDGMGMYPEMRTALWHTVSKHFFVHHDESIRGPIIGNVTHWMPLPEPPKEDE